MGNYLLSLRKLIGNRKVIHPGVRILIENDAKELLLIRRRDNDLWGLVAGGLEENETIEACAVREIEEETGLDVHSIEAIGLSSNPAQESVIYPNGDQVQYFTVVFYTNDWSGTLRQFTDETTEARFFPKDQLPPLPPNEQPSVEWLERYQQTGKFILE